MPSNNRVFRPAAKSDLPGIQSGKLKAIAKSSNDYCPARLVSSKYGNLDAVLFIYTRPDGKEFLSDLEGLHIDITPEMRYAAWNKRFGRFAHLGAQTVPSFTTKQEAENAIVTWTSRATHLRSDYVVIEFVYPGE